LWDSHPLALGATPVQVYIDGIPQLESPHVVHKPRSFQRLPNVPTFDKEATEAVKYEGLPPLEPKRADFNIVVFENVKSVFLPTAEGIHNVFSASNEKFGVVVVRNGSILCSGMQASCLMSKGPETIHVLDLKGDFLNVENTGLVG
jgi:hypothetical protein